MTGPMPQLPNVQLGNTAQDIGQGSSSFIKGMVDQRQRQQTIAMQQALANANVAHLGAQTTEVGAQTHDVDAQAAERDHNNSPADEHDELVLRHIWPDAPQGIFHGKTKKEALEYTKLASAMQMSQGRMGNSEENALRSAYDRESKAARTGIDNYRETLNAYNLASKSDNPIAGEGILLSWLKQRTNRMNQQEINRVASLGGVENMAHRFISHITGSVPMDPTTLRHFLDTSTPGGIAHAHDYQALRHNYKSMAIRRGYNPDDIVMDDDYSADIEALEQSVGVGKSTRSGPAGPVVSSRPQGLP